MHRASTRVFERQKQIHRLRGDDGIELYLSSPLTFGFRFMESTGTLMSEKADADSKQAIRRKLSAGVPGEVQANEGSAEVTRQVGDAQDRSANSVEVAQNAAVTTLKQISRLQGILTTAGTRCSEEFRDMHATSAAGKQGETDAASMFFGIMTSLDRLSALLADQY